MKSICPSIKVILMDKKEAYEAAGAALLNFNNDIKSYGVTVRLLLIVLSGQNNTISTNSQAMHGLPG